MEYRTNRVNSADIGPKNFERDGPKVSSARTEISKNNFRKKFLKKKIRATEFPMHEISGAGSATSRTPGDRFF
jgi:hypothetical protein